MKNKFIPLFTLALTFAAACGSQAQTAGSNTFPNPRDVASESEWKPHVGFKMGFASPEGSHSAAGNFGIDLGFQPAIPVGLAVEYSTTDSSLDRSYGLVKGSYNFGGDIAVFKNSYIGLGAGALFKSDGTDLVTAPAIGFDIPLKLQGANTSKFSLGASAQYLISASSDPDFLAVDAVIKYWY